MTWGMRQEVGMESDCRDANERVGSWVSSGDAGDRGIGRLEKNLEADEQSSGSVTGSE